MWVGIAGRVGPGALEVGERRVMAPAHLRVDACNCSMCEKLGFLHLIVDADAFRLLSGESDLTSYRFGTGTANHLFCRHCGVKPYYVPRSHPDGFSVNARCLDTGTIGRLDIEPFDGRNWEESVEALRRDVGGGRHAVRVGDAGQRDLLARRLR